MAKKTSTDVALVVLGLLAWAAAGRFGAVPITVETDVAVAGGARTTRVPSPSGAGAACGFAVAGGLCFLGAALAERPDRPA